jgi:2-haloacid dehalogenase
MPPEIKGIVWDVGNVLVAWDPSYLYDQLISDPAKSDWWVRHSFSMEWNLLGDLGMPYAKANPLWVERFERDHADQIAEFPQYRELIEAYGKYPQEAHPMLIADSINLRNALRAKYKTIALTNFSAENWPKVNAAHDGKIDQFDHVVMSARERVAKPDREIFSLLVHAAETRFGLKMEELLFVDDSAKNVAGAKDFGIAAIQFDAPEQLRREFKKFGIDTSGIPSTSELLPGKGLGKLPAIM